ncbi:MAG: hypothetical protein DRJ05_15700 [Bacteroidetes bacterium]|nr:MAG: hypothetical protein DRJ05_15700 [Bacteroidota bacterium]
MRIQILLLGFLFQLNIYAQNINEIIPQTMDFSYKDASVKILTIPFFKETYMYDSNGYMINSIADGIGDSIKLVKNYNYDTINNLFIIKNESYSNDSLIETHTKRYICSDFNTILDYPHIDFVTDSRLNIRDFIDDTLYIFNLTCLETVSENERGWYSYSTKMINDSLLKSFVVIKSNTGNILRVSYINPETKKTVYSEILEFGKNDNLIRRIKKYSTHTHDFEVTSRKGKIKKEVSKTIRRNENFTYSISKRKYKYNRKGLLTNQKTETKYLLQGHTTKSDFDFIYEFE